MGRTRGLTFADVRRIGRTLPGAEESTMYGSPALKVGGRMFACMAIHRSAEPGSLAVRVGAAQRDELIAGDPATYYVTDHYVDYGTVLVRLAHVHPDALADLLRLAHRLAGEKKRRRR